MRGTQGQVDDERILAYRRDMDGVRGWFKPGDFDAFIAVTSAQRERHIVGDLLEIGCFEGKSAILLGMLAGAGEDLIVCDIFDQASEEGDPGSEATYEGITQRRFEETYLRFHEKLPVIEAQPSSGLRHKYGERRFRIVHVDGSHEYRAVRGDLRFAASVTVEGGMVIVDDYRSAHTPGVAASFWEVSSEGCISPVFLTSNKGYAAVDMCGAEIGLRAVETLSESGYWFQKEEIQGRVVSHPGLQVAQPVRAGVARRIVDKLAMIVNSKLG